MPRTETSAPERTEQNRRLKERVAFELGVDVDSITLKSAIEYRKSQRAAGLWAPSPQPPNKGASPRHSNHLVPDRVLDFTDDELTLLGVVLAKVQSVTIERGFIKFVLLTAVDWAHTLTDAVLLSGHSLQVTMHEIAKSPEPADASEA